MKNQSEIFFHEIRMFLPSLLDFENVLCPMPVATPPLQKSRQHRNLLKKNIFFCRFLAFTCIITHSARCSKRSWMSRRKSRFYHNKQPAQNISRTLGSSTAYSVYKDASYFELLEKKNVDSRNSSSIKLLNASELAKSRKTWPFFSENA